MLATVSKADTSFVKISIEIEGHPANLVSVEKPYNNEFYPGLIQTDNAIQQLGETKFEFRIPYSGYSFFGIGFNREYYLPVALQAGDSIHIKAVRTSSSGNYQYKFHFTGSNSDAHRIYVKKFFPPGWNFETLNDLSKTEKSYTGYFLKAKQYIDTFTNDFDSLFQQNLVSKEIYDLYRADTRAILFEHAIKRLAKVKPADSGVKSFIEWNNTKHLMLFYGNAGDPILNKTEFGSRLNQLYLRYIIEMDSTVTDTALKQSYYSYFNYYDTAYREWAWGNLLYSLRKKYPAETDEETRDVALFKKYYPNSIYVRKLESFKDSMLAERKTQVRSVPVIDSVNKNSLAEIFQNISGRFFFIDVWATWCQPCIQEFTYQTSLTKFLEKKKIQEVFLSIDQERDKYKWQNFIKANFLPGYHFLLTNNAQKELVKVLSRKSGEGSLFIPRFLLYDKEANQYYLDLPRPSTGIGLETALDNIIKKANARN